MSRREKTPFRMEPFRVDDELHRSIRVENREDAASTVPLEEALLLDSAEQRQQLERLLKMQLADQPKEEQYGLGCRLAKVQLELAEYAAAEQTLAELTARWPVRETPWLLRLRSAAARKDGAELARWLAEMERAQVYLSAAGRREVDFWKGGGHP